jgi:hypothetical protein
MDLPNLDYALVQKEVQEGKVDDLLLLSKLQEEEREGESQVQVQGEDLDV